MKKAVAVALAGIVLLSAGLFFPRPVAAHDVGHCYDDYDACRVRAFNMDASWFKMTLALTLCDIALGRCILGFGQQEV